MFLRSITLVILVVVLHNQILQFILVGCSLFYLSVERAGKGPVVIVFCVRSVFVSHSTEKLVAMLSRTTGCLIQVICSIFCLSLVVLSLKLFYLVRRGVSWLTLVKWDPLGCSQIMGLVVCFLIGSMTRP